MKILSSFLSVDDLDSFFFMRGFSDFASREPMKARFYEGELWKLQTGAYLEARCWRSMKWSWSETAKA
jgi:hypothetical protein